MISEVMGYTFAVSLLITLAGYGLDRAGLLREGGRRWVWATTMLLSLVFPAAVLLQPPQANLASPPALSETAKQVDTLKAPAPALNISIAEEKSPPAQDWVVEHPRWYAAATLNIALTILWFVSSAVLALWLAIGRFILARKALGWPQERVEGHVVRVSDDSGPAVFGFWRPIIVLPRWLSVETRDLALRHEAQHLAAGDSRLVLSGLILLVLMPWNAPL